MKLDRKTAAETSSLKWMKGTDPMLKNVFSYPHIHAETHSKSLNSHKNLVEQRTQPCGMLFYGLMGGQNCFLGVLF